MTLVKWGHIRCSCLEVNKEGDGEGGNSKNRVNNCGAGEGRWKEVYAGKGTLESSCRAGK